MPTTTTVGAGLAVLAAGLLATGCASTIPGHPEPAASPASAAAPVETPQHLAAVRALPVVSLGDLAPPPTAASVGAPFNPCDAAVWSAVPADVRAAKPTSGPRYVNPPDPGDLICAFDTAQAKVLVAWGTAITADGGVPATYAGTPGIISSPGAVATGNECQTRVRLSHGVGAVIVRQATGQPDLCGIARPITDWIVQNAH